MAIAGSSATEVLTAGRPGRSRSEHAPTTTTMGPTSLRNRARARKRATAARLAKVTSSILRQLIASWSLADSALRRAVTVDRRWRSSTRASSVDAAKAARSTASSELRRLRRRHSSIHRFRATTKAKRRRSGASTKGTSRARTRSATSCTRSSASCGLAPGCAGRARADQLRRATRPTARCERSPDAVDRVNHSPARGAYLAIHRLADHGPAAALPSLAPDATIACGASQHLASLHRRRSRQPWHP